MLFDILSNVILAIFAIMGVGFLMDKLFKLDIATLSKLSFYVFTPAVALTTILRSNVGLGQLGQIASFAVAQMAILYVIGMGLFSLRPFAAKRTVLTFGAVFTNAGNYGIPLMALALGDLAVTVTSTVLLVQIVLFSTVGIVLFEKREQPFGKTVAKLLTIPAIYAVVIAVLMRAFNLTLPRPLEVPLSHLYNAFVAMGLLTLGAQLSRSRVDHNIAPLAALTMVRLILAPLLAAVLVLILRPAPSLAPALILGAGLPVAINVFILATEFDREAEFASQMVFWTTLISAVTIAAILLILK